MVLDSATRRNLGLDGLIETIDRTRTPMGQRALRRWIERPLLEVDRINQRLEAVDSLVGDYMLREEAREHLSASPTSSASPPESCGSPPRRTICSR
jgi:DNA mismatch repair protein MutS